MYIVVAHALQMPEDWAVFCLVVPAVWVIKMLPISLNGIGVAEGATVFLLGVFAVPRDKALALSLTVLGLQTVVALGGGLVLVVEMLRSTQIVVAAARPDVASVVPAQNASDVDLGRAA